MVSQTVGILPNYMSSVFYLNSNHKIWIGPNEKNLQRTNKHGKTMISVFYEKKTLVGNGENAGRCSL